MTPTPGARVTTRRKPNCIGRAPPPCARCRTVSVGSVGLPSSVVQGGPGVQQGPVRSRTHHSEQCRLLDDLGARWKPPLHRYEGVALNIEGVLQEAPVLPADVVEATIGECRSRFLWLLQGGLISQVSSTSQTHCV